MGGPSDEQRFPSLDEFQGWYNLGYERPDGIPVLHSKEEVPEFEHGEFFHMYVAENPWFEKLVPPSQLKPFDPVVGPPMFVKSDADDRTWDVVPDFDYVTLELIRRVQREFLCRHPFWRVVFMANDPSCTIVIYPEVIRFGNLPVGVNPEAALRELVPREIAMRESLLCPERALVAFIEQKLPEAIASIGDRYYAVVGLLDNNLEKYDRIVICLVCRRDQCHAIHIARPEQVDIGLMSSSGFGADAQGRIMSDSSMDDAAAYSVKLWSLPANCRGPLTIKNDETGACSTYEVRSEEITRTVPAE
jgi:hypothetical protein